MTKNFKNLKYAFVNKKKKMAKYPKICKTKIK